MKVKRLPEDFIVEELTDLQPAPGGAFALYRLRKQGLGTLEAVEALQRRWELPRRRLSWGGLKDKYAVTTQFLTIHRGPPRGLEQGPLRLEFVGWVDRPFQPGDIRGNRFDITLRNLTADETRRALPAIDAVQRDGLPNYFDDQRFGSLGPSGEFIAEPWIRGDYERTLWLALAEPIPGERAEERREKELLRTCWGDWTECKRRLARSHRRSIVTFLDDRPGDFKGAWARVNQDLRSLYLAAFQSQLWNEMLARLVRGVCGPDQLIDVPLKTGPVPFFQRPDAGQAAQLGAALLPLPSARIRVDEIADPALRELIVSTLAQRGLELRMIRVKHPRDSFFSKGVRRAIVPIPSLRAVQASDDLHAGRQLLRLEFDLPRGSYATMLIKRLTTAAGAPLDAEPVIDDESPAAGDGGAESEPRDGV